MEFRYEVLALFFVNIILGPGMDASFYELLSNLLQIVAVP